MAQDIEDRKNTRAELIRERRQSARDIHEAYRMGRSRSGRVGHIFAAAVMIAAAALIGAQTFGLLPQLNHVDIKFVILAFFLAALGISSAFAMGWFQFFFGLSSAGVIANTQFKWIDFSAQQTWEIFAMALLLSTAFSILFHPRRPSFPDRNLDDHGRSARDRNLVGLDNDDKVYIFARMSESTRYVESQNLKRVVVSARMGGAVVYFANAKPAGDSLEINVDARFGGIQLNVPKNWKMINNVNSIVGGVSEKNFAEIDENSPTVTLTGNARLGGIEVNYI